ncbi:DUF4386 domain-containing protein [Archaeoglobus veneficus]|uniref:DUF4386 domain-containing protein n=1 Tax=Archaeoglobus veneficus (strain DSM 11195 / SNP6) TaxID=693661 RepID=F2KR30_ARCVS|nr:DUF4386 domain-containing protein [Archaeoglobus veneficus]AEA46667.1 hypothetical protein Arcve_0647 [Archaeoglobus veneficus SNP6]
MKSHIADISLRKAAIVAGFGLLFMTIAATFAYFYVLSNLIVPGDAATTANNIMANELLFRTAIDSFIIVVILDVVVAWALYVLLKPVNKSLSLLAAWFRLVYATIFGISLHNFFSVLLLLSGADYLTVFETGQLHAQVMLFLNAFSYGWLIGLVFFGLHLSVLGYLVFKSGYIPRILGVLLIIAGFGYLIDSFAKFLFPNYEATIGLFTFIGELLFMLWLLLKGAKIPEMKS